MGYLSIHNLYRTDKMPIQAILGLKRVYCLEKIHGTSANISFTCGKVHYFSGGERHENFVKLFDESKLVEAFNLLGIPTTQTITVFGEAYGGKCQGMSATYGKELKFVAFDVKIGDSWLNVPNAETICRGLGIEFVNYVETSTELVELDAQKDSPSIQAVRNGILEPKKREGVVIRPLVELSLNNGDRVIAKHKGDDFRETSSPRVVDDPAKLKVLEEAEAIALEWATPNRLEHVLQKIEAPSMEKMREIINAMVADVIKEGTGEIVDSPAMRKAISTRTAKLYKNLLASKLVLDTQPTLG